jgi:uncharacterized protein with von Willebrand factor type A (vWA) domain
MHFARTLRAAGLPVGPGKLLDAVDAVRTVGIESRRDFYWTLHAVFVNRRDQREIFDQAFHIFWRNPQILEKAMAAVLPQTHLPPDENAKEMSRRLADALAPPEGDEPQNLEEELEIDAALTFSAREVLQSTDFETMSADEISQAKQLVRAMRLPIMAVPTRRFVADPNGARADMRATLRAALRSGGGMIDLKRRSRRTRHPPIVMLCDISGSMSRYSRIFLHFMHAVTNDRDRVHTFLFGTRLTNVTRYLRYKDVDVALDRITTAVEDWSGGTRIGQCLAEFNRLWSRRVLGQGAIVLLITDGLDRDAGTGLDQEVERLHKSCRRLIWLNPLLRFDGFEPRSSGVRAILPHVDDFRTVHNLDSLAALTEALGRPQGRRLEAAERWQMRPTDQMRPSGQEEIRA